MKHRKLSKPLALSFLLPGVTAQGAVIHSVYTAGNSASDNNVYNTGGRSFTSVTIDLSSLTSAISDGPSATTGDMVFAVSDIAYYYSSDKYGTTAYFYQAGGGLQITSGSVSTQFTTSSYSSGISVGNSSSFSNVAPAIENGFGGNTGSPAYVGFKYQTNNPEPLYGWVRYTAGEDVNSGYSVLTVHELALDTSGAAVTTGIVPVPEPSGLALLALGAGACATRRRRVAA